MIYEFRFPDIGEGVHEGIVLEWRRSPGDRVSQGDVLALVETDKVAAEIPSPADGTLVSRGVEEGATIEVGQVLASLEVAEEPAAGSPAPAAAQAPEPPAAAPAPLAVPAEAVPEPAGDAGARAGQPAAIVGRLEAGGGTVLPPSTEGRPSLAVVSPAAGEADRKVKASPLARRLAAQKQIDLRRLRGTGPEGRVLKADILREAQAAEGRSAAAAEAVPEVGRLTPLSQLRRTLARNMEKSWQIPAALVQDSTAVDELVRARELINAGSGGETQLAGIRLTFLPFFLKAAALALGEFPLLNSLYYPEKESYLESREINVGIALDTPRGLLVPVIRGVERLSLTELQQRIDDLKRQAAEQTLQVAYLRGGTFTVTNYGSVGGSYGRPLIFPPQVAILGIGRIAEAPLAREGQLVSGRVLPLSLVFDHRVVDGVYAARFLSRFMRLVSEPYTLLAALR